MKILLASLIVVLSTHIVFAEPGGSYTLTGNEKSIEAIVKADMEQHPDLYVGEYLRNYVAKFKNENKIGRNKLAPGDILIFPDTRASLKAKGEAKQRKLIGRWKSEWESEITAIREFKENGEHIYEMVVMEGKLTLTMFGLWVMEDDCIRIKDMKSKYGKTEKQGTKKWAEHKILLLTDNELHTQVEGQKVLKYTRIE